MDTSNIMDFFKNGVRTLTGLSLGAGYPNALSVPHMIGGAFKNFLALGISTGHQFKELQSALSASANAVSAPTGGNAGGKVEAKVEEVVEEEEANVSMGGLFSD